MEEGHGYALCFNVIDYTRHLFVLRFVGTQSARPPTTLAVPIRQSWIPRPQRVFGHLIGFQRPPINHVTGSIAYSDLWFPRSEKGRPQTQLQRMGDTME